MKKLLFSLIVILLVGSFILGGCTKTEPTATVPSSGEIIKINMFGGTSPQTLNVKAGYEPWQAKIVELTDGKVEFSNFFAGSIGGTGDMWDLCLNGTIDITSWSHATKPGLFHGTSFIQLPFIFPSAEVSSVAGWRIAQKYLQDTEYKPVKILMWYSIPPVEVHTNVRQVRTLEDFKGMKLAVDTEMETYITKALGAVPTPIPTAERYGALERGLVDGCFFIWEGAFIFKINEVTKYRTGNVRGWTVGWPIITNPDFWNSLPPDIQKIIEDLSGEKWTRDLGIAYDGAADMFLGRIKEFDQTAGNPEIYWLPEDERARWVEAIMPVRDEWVKTADAKGLPGKAILEDAISMAKELSK